MREFMLQIWNLINMENSHTQNWVKSFLTHLYSFFLTGSKDLLLELSSFCGALRGIVELWICATVEMSSWVQIKRCSSLNFLVYTLQEDKNLLQLWHASCAEIDIMLKGCSLKVMSNLAVISQMESTFYHLKNVTSGGVQRFLDVSEACPIFLESRTVSTAVKVYREI